LGWTSLKVTKPGFYAYVYSKIFIQYIVQWPVEVVLYDCCQWHVMNIFSRFHNEQNNQSNSDVTCKQYELCKFVDLVDRQNYLLPCSKLASKVS